MQLSNSLGLVKRFAVLNASRFPHLWQGDTANPSTHCFPAAASNVIMAVKAHCPSLTKENHLAIENHLATAMQTDAHSLGTELTHCLQGLEKFLTSLNIPYQRITYHGAMNVPQTFQLANQGTEGKPPSLQTLKDILAKGEPCMGILGWYYHDAAEGLYRRYGSHGVTLLGHEKNYLTQQQHLLLRDPNLTWPNPWQVPLLSRLAIRAVKYPKHPLYAQNIKEETAYFPLKSAGFMQVNTTLPMKPQGTVAILEGFIHLEGLANKKWVA